MKNEAINTVFEEAKIIAAKHYENFPVVSFFVPASLRKYVAMIYVFARQADDLADEGVFSKEQRLEKLEEYEDDFNNALKGIYKNPFWNALHLTIEQKTLDYREFLKLLKAFKQDVVKNRYSDFNELLNYCSNSANPVGRIILDLYNLKDEKLKLLSDKICTALQLTNFYQDVSIDYQKGRIYIPVDEMSHFNVTEKDLELKININQFKSLMEYQVNRTKEFFSEGSGLITYLPNPLKFEIRWTILGGKNILKKIEKVDYDVLNQRPILSKINYLYLMILSILKV
jgi:squalene synthase HpnC